jgi:hypothetical protein
MPTRKVLVYRQANRYTLKEVNQMEREMGSYLECLFHVEAPELEALT